MADQPISVDTRTLSNTTGGTIVTGSGTYTYQNGQVGQRIGPPTYAGEDKETLARRAKAAEEQRKREEAIKREAQRKEALERIRLQFGGITPAASGQSTFLRQAEARNLSEEQLASRSRATIAAASLARRVAEKDILQETEEKGQRIKERFESGDILGGIFETITPSAGVKNIRDKIVIVGDVVNTPLAFGGAVSGGIGSASQAVTKFFGGGIYDTPIQAVSKAVPTVAKEAAKVGALYTGSYFIPEAATQVQRAIQSPAQRIPAEQESLAQEAEAKAIQTVRFKFQGGVEKTQTAGQPATERQVPGQFPSLQQFVSDPLGQAQGFGYGLLYAGAPGVAAFPGTASRSELKVQTRKELVARGFTEAQANARADEFANRVFSQTAQQVGIEASGNIAGGKLIGPVLSRTGFNTFGRRALGGFLTVAPLGAIEGGLQVSGQASAERRQATTEELVLGGVSGAVSGGLLGGIQVGVAPAKTLSKGVLGVGYALDFPGEPAGDIATALGIKAGIAGAGPKLRVATAATTTGTILTELFGVEKKTPKSKPSAPTPASVSKPSASTKVSSPGAGVPFSPAIGFGSDIPVPIPPIEPAPVIPPIEPTPVPPITPAPVQPDVSPPPREQVADNVYELVDTTVPTDALAEAVSIPITTARGLLLPPLFGFGMGVSSGGRSERTEYYNELSAALNSAFGPSTIVRPKTVKTKRKKRR